MSTLHHMYVYIKHSWPGLD